MRRRTSQYANLEGLGSDRESVSWIWRLAAFAASWLIIGGYLILGPTITIAKDDNDSKLRVSRDALDALGIVLYVLGYALSILVWVMSKSLLFQVDSIFTPCLTSSSLSLLTVIYSLLVTKNISVTVLPIVSLIIAALASIIYATLLVLTWRRLQRSQRSHSTVRGGEPTSPSTDPSTGLCLHSCPVHALGGSGVGSARASTVDGGATMSLPPWQTPEYYKNYIANMFPSMASSPADTRPSAEPSEEEQQRLQMMQLLLRTDEPAGGTANGTFRIDMQIPDDEPTTAIDPGKVPEEWRRMTAQQKQAMARGFMMGRQQGHRDTTRLGPGAWDRRGRGEERQRSQERAVSREERRRQIEMGVNNERGAGRPF